MAAGNTVEEALIQGISELYERYFIKEYTDNDSYVYTEVKINNEMQSKYIIYVLSSNMMEIKNDFVSNDKVKFDKVYSNGIGTIIDNSIITDKEINAKFIVSRATNVIIGKRNVEKEYNNVDELEKDIIEYIEYYNNKRIKGKLKGMSPVQYRVHSQVA